MQSLLTIRRRLELFEATEGDASRLAQILELQEIVDDTLNGIRQISKDLRPLILEDLGLLPALQMLARSMHNGPQAIPHVRLEVSGEKGYIPPDRELSIYRIVQEALTNVRKHARATKALIGIRFEPGMVSLAIEDDGAGFEAPEPLAELAKHDRYGLIGIEERVWAAGGALSIQSAPGRGTRLCVNIPLEQDSV